MLAQLGEILRQLLEIPGQVFTQITGYVGHPFNEIIHSALVNLAVARRLALDQRIRRTERGLRINAKAPEEQRGVCGLQKVCRFLVQFFVVQLVSITHHCTYRFERRGEEREDNGHTMFKMDIQDDIQDVMIETRLLLHSLNRLERLQPMSDFVREQADKDLHASRFTQPNPEEFFGQSDPGSSVGGGCVIFGNDQSAGIETKQDLQVTHWRSG